MMKFPCTGCGCCCKRVRDAVENIGEVNFPYKWDDTGKCEMLSDDNKCKVYDNRPEMCSVDRMMKIYDIPREIFYEMNAEVCNNMMDMDGINESFRIKKPGV